MFSFYYLGIFTLKPKHIYLSIMLKLKKGSIIVGVRFIFFYPRHVLIIRASHDKEPEILKNTKMGPRTQRTISLSKQNKTQ